MSMKSENGIYWSSLPSCNGDANWSLIIGWFLCIPEAGVRPGRKIADVIINQSILLICRNKGIIPLECKQLYFDRRVTREDISTFVSHEKLENPTRCFSGNLSESVKASVKDLEIYRFIVYLKLQLFKSR